MKIFISGSNGMVGRNLSNLLSVNGYDLLTPSRQEVDLLDELLIDNFLKKHKPDIIIHCAGVVGGIAMNIENQAFSLNSNTLMGINLINSAKRNGVPRFINLASSCMYPKNILDELKIDDLLSGKLEPTNEGYAIAKILVWKYLNYSSNKNFKGKTIIPCNLYGPYDNFDLSSAHLIPAAIMKVHSSLERGDSIEIWGRGIVRREFMYAEDMVDFIRVFLERFDDMPNECNLGIENDYTILDYYEKICDVVGAKKEFILREEKPEGMKRKKLDISFQKSINWKPQHSLKHGIEKTYDFFKKTLG